MEVKDRLARVFTARGRARQRARRLHRERANQALKERGVG
jgi:hypothetical protein